jgi:hypothetical protein
MALIFCPVLGDPAILLIKEFILVGGVSMLCLTEDALA